MPIFDPASLSRQVLLAQLQNAPDEQTSTTASQSAGNGNGLYRAGQAALIGSNAFDAGTTLNGWGHGDMEQNPLIGNSVAKLLLFKGLGTAAQLALMHELATHGHPKIAGAIGLGMSGPPTVAGIHNLQIR